MFFVLDDFFVFIHFQIYQAMLPKLLVSFYHMLLRFESAQSQFTFAQIEKKKLKKRSNSQAN